MAGMMEPIRERNEAPGGKVESILAAAKRTFLADGYGAVSMDTIAREARVAGSERLKRLKRLKLALKDRIAALGRQRQVA